MVNLRWDIYNMITIWLMVGILFVLVGGVKSVVTGGASSQGMTP